MPKDKKYKLEKLPSIVSKEELDEMIKDRGLEDETLEPGKEYLEKAKGGMIVARGSRLVKVKPTKLY
jgi:hypothetical protein